MGVFSALFGRFRPKMKLYFGLGGSSPGWNRDVYEQETVRAIIDCIASHAAKAEALHVVMDHNGRVKKIKRDSPYAKLLNQRPNSLMSGYDLKYKLVAQLEDKTTALAYIKWEGTTPVAIIPISYQQFTFGEIAGGGYAVMFTDDTDGREYTLNVEDVVILRKFYNRRTLAGDGNQPIYNTLAMVRASDEGLTEALTVANKVRGLLRQKKAMLAAEHGRLCGALCSGGQGGRHRRGGFHGGLYASECDALVCQRRPDAGDSGEPVLFLADERGHSDLQLQQPAVSGVL